MLDLRPFGVELHSSELTQRTYQAAPCQFLVPVTADNREQAISRLQKEGCGNGLRISGIADLSFLNDFPGILYLEIVEQKRVNTRHLDGLNNLRGLRLDSPGAGIDFACFPELEVFIGDWHVDNRNLARARELRRLKAWKFKPRSRDLRDLADIPRLESLDLIQTNMTSDNRTNRVADALPL